MHQSYWQQTAPAFEAHADLPAVADVVVVGGGLLGTAIAYWLARAGASTTLVERSGIAAGATGRNGGFMIAGTAEPYQAAIARVGHVTAREVWQLTLDSRRLLRAALAEEHIDCAYREPGHLSLALGEGQLEQLEQEVEALRGDGLAAELLDRGQVQQIIRTPLGPEIVGGLSAPEDGLLHPARLVLGLADAAARHGARICLGTAVTAVHGDGCGVKIATGRGVVRAGAAVLAVNGWSAALLPALADVIRPVRGQALSFAPIAPIFPLGVGAAMTPTGEYWHQAPDGTIVLGGARAVAPGLDVGVLSTEPTVEVQEALDGIFPRLFPKLAPLRVTRRWAGTMAFTADYLPIADRAPGLPGVWLVGGFCGHGMPFGMRLGQLLAEAAATGEAPPALRPLRLDRPTLDRG